MAAAMPRVKMVMEKAQAVSVKDQPSSRTSRVWKKLHAYTVPRQICKVVLATRIVPRCTARGTAGTASPSDRRR